MVATNKTVRKNTKRKEHFQWTITTFAEAPFSISQETRPGSFSQWGQSGNPHHDSNDHCHLFVVRCDTIILCPSGEDEEDCVIPDSVRLIMSLFSLNIITFLITIISFANHLYSHHHTCNPFNITGETKLSRPDFYQLPSIFPIFSLYLPKQLG